METALDEMNQLNTLAQSKQVDITNIFWVITVPAIWDEMSMELMKLCARRAGMVDFELGTEPIVSTFFALYTSKEEIKLNRGKKFIVLDCGGGTTDASCIKVENNEKELSELYHGDGIFCGGLKIDQLFLSYLETIFPDELIKQIKSKHAGHWITQRKNFVNSRWFVPHDLNGKSYNVKLAFPFSKYINKIQKESKSKSKKKKKNKKKKNKDNNNDEKKNDDDKKDAFNELKKKIEEFRPKDYSKYVEIFKKDKRYRELVKSINDKNNNDDDDDNDNDDEKKIDYKSINDLGPLFKLPKRGGLKLTQIGWDILHYDVTKQVSLFLSKLTKQPGVDRVKDVILVGGFAQSKYLQYMLKKDHSNLKFHSSTAPQLAVVKGALWWICHTNKLSKHKSKWTYGIAIDKQFSAGVDDLDRKEEDKNELQGYRYMVRNAFQAFVDFNEAIPDNFKKEFTFSIPKNSEKIEIPIWVTKSKTKRYVYNDDKEPVIPVKKFYIQLKKSNKHRDFKLTFEYNHNGVRLCYKHPNTGQLSYFMVKHEDIDILKTDFEDDVKTKLDS